MELIYISFLTQSPHFFFYLFGDSSCCSNLGLAATANEDTYLTILDSDGKDWADKLRHRMRNHERDEPALSEGDCLLLPKIARYV